MGADSKKEPTKDILTDKECIAEYRRLLRHLGKEEGVVDFIGATFTKKETVRAFRRFQIALLILQEVPQRDISDRLGVGTGKIFRVRRWLFQDGRKLRAYKKAVKAFLSYKEDEREKWMREKEQQRQKSKQSRPKKSPPPWWHWSRMGS